MKFWIVGLISAVCLSAGAPLWAQSGAIQSVLVQQTQDDGTPTTQPAQVNVQIHQNGNNPETLVDRFEHTRVGELFKGDRTISLREMMTLPFWLDTIRDFVVAVVGFVPRMMVAILFLFFFYMLYRGVRKIVVGAMARANVDESIRNMLAFLLKWAIMGFGLVIAGNQVGIQIAALLTGVSIIGLAVGFAAQETLSNFIAGIVIFWDRPFKIGDWVEVDNHLAQVSRVTFRSTRLTDLDGDVVVMPNTLMLAQKLVNKSTNPVTRVNIPIGIAYKESIDRAREVLLETIKGDSRIVSRPESEVVVRECAASSVDLMLHIWIREEKYEDAMLWEYLEKAKKALDAAGIEIPFPHTQLFVEETPAIHLLAERKGDAA